MAGQPGFFDADERLKALSVAGDPLERLSDRPHHRPRPRDDEDHVGKSHLQHAPPGLARGPCSLEANPSNAPPQRPKYSTNSGSIRLASYETPAHTPSLFALSS
jgi:hypothetical protein